MAKRRLSKIGNPITKITYEDAVKIVWPMLWDGVPQSVIAAQFNGQNHGRVSEINTGKRFPGSEAEARVFWGKPDKGGSSGGPSSPQLPLNF